MIRLLKPRVKQLLTVLLIIPFIAACGSVSLAPADPTGTVAGSSVDGSDFIPGTGTCNREPRYDNQNLGEIRGRVHNSRTPDDYPFVGAFVHLVPTDQETTTDSSGNFIFGNLIPGMYQILVRTREGYASTTEVRARAGMVCLMDDVVASGVPVTGDAAPTPDFSTIQIIYKNQPVNGAYVWFEGDNHVLVTDPSGFIRLGQMPMAPVHVAYNGHWAYYDGPINALFFQIQITDQGTQPVLPQNPVYISPELQPFNLPFANP